MVFVNGKGGRGEGLGSNHNFWCSSLGCVLLYLSELSADNTFSVRWATGSCRLHFSLPAQNVEEARLGPVRCREPAMG
jgi:hypothetical protein